MTTIIKYFLKLTEIPHCSYEAKGLRDFLVEFAKSKGCETTVDDADNILISKGKPKLCLQAHYDMVCMGKAPAIETYEEDGWLKAKDSSLGADNGMAVAMMMRLMEEGAELEFLLTADEEVGLIGANALEFELQSECMLNLDFEDEAEVCVGCAGGADVTAVLDDDLVDADGICYEVAVKGLDGGHSGVDIDKGIPSAIKVLGKYLYENNITQISAIYAGERRNSIPSNAVAVVRSTKELESAGDVKVRELNESPKVLKRGAKLVELIYKFQHGVRVENIEMGIPDSSINLAIITANDKGEINIDTSARSMNADALEELVQDTVKFFDGYGYKVAVEDKYPSWKPEINEFTDIVSHEMKAVFGKTKTMAIHAGLECGVISEKYPHMKFVSIGPTIRYPHSTREMVNIESIKQTFKVLARIIDNV